MSWLQEEPPPLSAPEVVQVALREIAELTGRHPLGATSVVPSDDGWTVEVEVVEDRRIPSSTDMLALYEVVLDLDGELLSYRRTRDTSAVSPTTGWKHDCRRRRTERGLPKPAARDNRPTSATFWSVFSTRVSSSPATSRSTCSTSSCSP